MAQKLVEIDGSVLEGGGQILRNALAFSALTRTPIRISNIRTGRARPGLKEQHLKGVQLIQALTAANVQNAVIGSTEIEFYPGEIHAGHFKSIVKTAGSISLLLQVALPCCLFAPAPIKLRLEGGTNAAMAPQVEYLTEVFRPNLERMGGTFDFNMIRRGYFPRGGGRVHVSIQPVQQLKPIVMLEAGDVKSIYGWCFAAGCVHISEAETMAEAARNALQVNSDSLTIVVYHENESIAPIGDCAGIVLVAETSTGCIVGGSALMDEHDLAADVGKEAAEELWSSLHCKACVDEQTQDQLIIFMALACGRSRVRVGNVTLHTKTAIYIAELLTNAKFKIETYGEYSIIECDGIGYKRQ